MDAGAVASATVSTPPPQLTPDLEAMGVALRLRRDADADFLCDVYVAHRWPEMAATGWPPQTCLAFLRDQHRLQDLNYRKFCDGAAWCVIEVGGERAGRLYLFLRDGDLRLMDIALMPAYRNRGVGGALIRAIQDQAAGLGAAKVSLYVEGANPALRLYERLGFKLVEAGAPYHRFEWLIGLS
jgi:ribosomal protein S18 acetylase RimI-like enzyme